MDELTERAVERFVSELPGGTHGLNLVVYPFGDVKVGLFFREDLNFALVHNGIGIFAGLGIAVDPVEDPAAKVTHTITGLRAHLRSGRFDDGAGWHGADLQIESGKYFWAPQSALKWGLDTSAFFALDEATPDIIDLEFELDGTFTKRSVDVRFLAHDQWSPLNIPETIAAFVQPRAHAVTKVLSAAADLLQERTDDPSLVGYQRDAERVVDTARAIYDAIKGLDIRYATPPASFEDSGQKVRTSDAVLDTRFGTCLDTTVLFAAALEEAGLQPYIVVLPGHAFVGFSLRELNTPSAMTDTGSITNLFGSGYFIPVETTAATAGHDVGFDEAVKAAAQAAQGGSSVEYVVSVSVAHRRVMPLPTMSTSADGTKQVVYVEPATGARQADPLERARKSGAKSATDDAGQTHVDERMRLGGGELPLRVQKWRSELLDLSLRNPLLKLSAGRGVRILLPEADLPILEDLLADNQRVELTPDNVVEEIDAVRGVESAVQYSDARLTSLFNDEGRVFVKSARGGALSKLNTLRREAKAMLEESGSNALYLAVGFLRWPVKSSSVSGSEALSPLFLLPVELTGSPSKPYSMRVEPNSELHANYALIEKLKQEYGMTIPQLEEPPTDDSGIDVARIFQELRQRFIGEGLGFSVEGIAQLALVKFASLDMWRDVGDHWQELAGNDVVKHLIYDSGELMQTSAQQVHVEPQDEAEAFLPLPADGSQLESVKAASAGESFVLEGPPGTGKSQTIANIIANSLAHDRTILFVAEKQAALSVVEDRLDQVGLKPLTLNAHGIDQTVGKVRTQLRAAIRAQGQSNRAVFDALRTKLARVITDLDEYPHSVHGDGHSAAAGADSIWNSYQRCAVLERAMPAEQNWQAEQIHVSDELLAASSDHINQLLTELNRAYTRARGERLSVNWLLVGPDFSAQDADALRGFFGAVKKLLGVFDEIPPEIFQILQACDSAQNEAFTAWLRDLDTGSGVFPDQLQQHRIGTETANRQRQNLGQFVQTWAAFAVQLSPAAAMANAVQLQQEFEAAQNSGRLGRKKKVATVLNRILPLVQQGSPLEGRIAGGAPSEVIRFLTGLDAYRRSEAAARQDVGLDGPYRRLPLHAEAAMQELDRRYETERDFAEHAAKLQDFLRCAPELVGVVNKMVADHRATLKMGRVTELLGEFEQTWSRLVSAAGASNASLEAWLSGDRESNREWEGSHPLQTRGFDARLPARLSTCRAEWRQMLSDEVAQTNLSRQLRLQSALAGLNSLGLGSATARIASGERPEGLQAALELAAARERLLRELRRHDMDTFDGSRYLKRVKEYVDISDKLRTMTKQELPARLLEQRAGFEPSVGLRKELDRKSGGSIRRIFERFSDEVLRLTPVVLMSPATVARSLPIDTTHFDTVIFDEASQVKVADAIGAIGRADSVVVVGDSKQMPPTSAFSTSSAGDEEELTDIAPTQSLAPEAQQLVDIVGTSSAVQGDATVTALVRPTFAATDQESILSEVANSGLSRKWLRWHYRSQHDSLISFSNAKYYEGNLQVFPAPPENRDGLGVSSRFVNGVFDSGKKGTRTNQAEAEAVVEDISVRLAVNPTASIGVVTFNTQQRDLILDLMEQSSDAEVRRSLERAEEPVFVKNLESVQGDERDVILFSIAFSKNPDTGKLSHNFGPLNNAGGERRLNVAVTRARRAVVIFTSIRAADINPARTSAQGVLDLRDYLAAAEAQEPYGAHDERHSAAVDMFRTGLSAALHSVGLEVLEDVGTSDFRVNLAVRSDDEHGWVGLLLDSPEWAGRKTTSDRMTLPGAILQGVMGWDATAQIMLVDWISDPTGVVDRVVQLAGETERQYAPIAPVGPAASNDAVETVTPATEHDEVAEQQASTVGKPVETAKSPADSDSDPDRMVTVQIPAPESIDSQDTNPTTSAGALVGATPLQSIAPTVDNEEASAPVAAEQREQEAVDRSGEYEFVEAPNEVIGEQSVLDNYQTKENKAKIAAEIDDIIEVEGPIQADRLAKVVGNRFGLMRVSVARKKQILSCSSRKPVHGQDLGDFYWPDDLTPDTYSGYRPRYNADTVLGIGEVSHVELGNVMGDALRSAGDMSKEELIRGVMEVFGWSRMGAKIKERMNVTIDWLVARGKVTVGPDDVVSVQR
nr:DUF3320 domain-containing protein [Brevibacterium sp. 68QC2CO]